MARAGNSADQAALLAALLTASGVPVRFVEGELDASQAQRLLAASTLDVEAAPSHARGSRRGKAGRLMAVAAPARRGDQARIVRRSASGEQVVSWVRGQVLDTVELLESALASAGMPIPEQPAELPELETQRHVWLQMASGPAWIDLDPSIGDGDPATSSRRPARRWTSFRTTCDIGSTSASSVSRSLGGSLVQETLLEGADYADASSACPSAS